MLLSDDGGYAKRQSLNVWGRNNKKDGEAGEGQKEEGGELPSCFRQLLEGNGRISSCCRYRMNLAEP